MASFGTVQPTALAILLAAGCADFGLDLYTQGVDALSDVDKQAVFQQVREFSDFTEDNDPHGEHDFGAFTHGSDKFFWKIDYYAADMMHGSEDPADPSQTHRVLTIMLASEY